MISHSRFDVEDGGLEGEGGVQEEEEVREGKTEWVDGGEGIRRMGEEQQGGDVEPGMEVVGEEGEEQENFRGDEEEERGYQGTIQLRWQETERGEEGEIVAPDDDGGNGSEQEREDQEQE